MEQIEFKLRGEWPKVSQLVIAVTPWVVGWQCLYWFCRTSAPALFVTYETLNEKKGEKGYWASSMVSTAHAVTIAIFVGLALWDEPSFLTSTDFLQVTPASLQACYVFFGYILSDLFVSVFYGSLWSGSIANLLHHLFVLLAWSQFITARCGQLLALMGMFCEVTTPFVNQRWFLDKAGMKDGALYFVNGLMMLASFFVWRIALYLWVGVRLYEQREGILSVPALTACTILLSYLVGLALQMLWFRKMVLGTVKLLRKRKAGSHERMC
jgi:hypothetical protein